MTWFVYLIECADGSVYTGIATDVDARYAKHVSDVRLMLKYRTFDPHLAAGSIAELSRATDIPIDRLFPLARMIEAASSYRDRRKRHSPGQTLPMYGLPSLRFRK